MRGSELFASNNVRLEINNFLLKSSFSQMLFWFNVFVHSINDLINASNINADHIKRVFLNALFNTNC
jgi:hypothetical protein